jgi:uncharacterized membrane protein (DUF485 family)
MIETVFGPNKRLSLATLFKTFPGIISFTWALMLVETVLFSLLPLLIGWSIDGLLADDPANFILFVGTLLALVAVSIARRVYDTRAYGTVRVELGKELAQRGKDRTVSVTNARVQMGRELVDFLEMTAPETLAAIIQILVSVILLLSFHPTLAASATGAAVTIVIMYAISARFFFRINADLNARLERQVSVLQTMGIRRVSAHFLGLRRAEVRLSDLESFVYGLIFLVLLSMLAFNLWFAATKSGATSGQIFAIVTYSWEFVQASVALPTALQALTRLKEITERINSVDGDQTDEKV